MQSKNKMNVSPITLLELIKALHGKYYPERFLFII